MDRNVNRSEYDRFTYRADKKEEQKGLQFWNERENELIYSDYEKFSTGR